MKAKKNQDVPGNALATAAGYQRRLIRLGETLMRLESVLDRLFEEDVVVTSIRLRLAAYEGDDVLAVVRALIGGERQVCFHSAATVYETLEGVVNRLQNGSVRWREDKYDG